MAQKRFDVIYTQGMFNTTKVLRDNGTGVLYLVQQEGFGTGLTPLLDREGKPLVDEHYLAARGGPGAS